MLPDIIPRQLPQIAGLAFARGRRLPQVPEAVLPDDQVEAQEPMVDSEWGWSEVTETLNERKTY